MKSLLQDRIRELETQLRSRADTSASSREIYLLESQNQTLSSVIDRQKATIALLQTQLDATMAADRVRRVVLPETQPRVDEGVRRVADVNDAVIDAGPYSRPGKRPRDDTAAPYDDACSGQAR
ncbi:hypothetical protein QYF36_011573 [Acer negundo]|nr:hypothetical protein Q3G72_035341 [Acer saccharum]KAK4838163.1 hypothetical protein QYF36_011573 [Acer negundo]